MGQDASQTTRRKACIQRLQNGKKPKIKPLKNGKKSTETGDTATGFASNTSLKAGKIVIQNPKHNNLTARAVHTHETMACVPVPATPATKSTAEHASVNMRAITFVLQPKREKRIPIESGFFLYTFFNVPQNAHYLHIWNLFHHHIPLHHNELYMVQKIHSLEKFLHFECLKLLVTFFHIHSLGQHLQR